MKKINYCIGIFAVLSQIVIAILYHCGKVTNIQMTLVISAIITAIVFLVANSWNNWFKGALIAILSLAITFGFGTFATMCGYVGTYAVTQTNNLIQINKITEEKDFIKVMSYDGKDYYVDTGYTYLYEIERAGLLSSIEAHTIMIDSSAENIFNDMFGEFYEVNNNDAFSNIGNVKVSIAFVKQNLDNSCFIKLINNKNKVFYSYLTLDNPSKLIQDMNIAKDVIEIGQVDIIITKPSKIIDGTTSDDNALDYIDGQQYILTVGKQTILSEITLIAFEQDNGYYNRLNYYLYKSYFEEIEKYQNELEKLNKDTQEYKDMESYIQNIQNMISSYTCDLCYELVQPQRTVRLYRAFIKSGELESVPNMTVIEIEYDDYYLYALTEITLDELK